VEWGKAEGGSAGDEVHWHAGLVEETVESLPQPDLIVTNPPRAGMARTVSTVIDRWAANRPGGRLAYVSCDPATLARDLKRMPHLRMRSVTAYDLFPQTCHVETLAVLEAQ
jgi:23S rRNA (uracil1939-C5)-methyltransferase